MTVWPAVVIGSGEVEAVELLELLLDAVGHLLQGLLDRRARPVGLDDHRLDGEVGVFLTAEIEVGEHAGDDETSMKYQTMERWLSAQSERLKPFTWPLLREP